MHIKLTWLAPLFPRNKIAFYRLKIKSQPERDDKVDIDEKAFEVQKDVQISSKSSLYEYTTGPLKMGTKYNVSLSAVNRDGDEGTY